MNYQSLVDEINSSMNEDCFRRADVSSIQYLEGLGLSKEILEFYREYEPAYVIEIEEIRLLPISEIMEENVNYTPGYLLSPHGYCAVASTIYGDIYCVKSEDNGDVVVLASHDEIYEGQEMEKLMLGVRGIEMNFFQFLNAFATGGLVKSFYDVK